jgi:phosphoribosylamine--glycine ligase
MPYIGFLSTDIVLTKNGPRALGYSAHFSSAAAQAVLPLLDTSLASIMKACIDGRQSDIAWKWVAKTSVMVSISATTEEEEIRVPKPLSRFSHVR